MKRILIVQARIAPYRVPFFTALGQLYDLTIVHSGSCVTNTDSQYKEIYLPKCKIGPFYHQQKLMRLVKRGRYDVVIVMFDIRWLSVPKSLISSPSRLVLWGHRYSRSRLANRIRDLLMHKADAILLYGEEEVDEICQRGLPKERIFVAPNTIDVPNHEDCSESPKDSFLFVGRAQARKKVDEFISAYALAKPQLPCGVKINIVGAGAENDRLKKLVAEKGVENDVVFHGELNDSAQLKELFACAHAYVSPGPVGLGVLHSFAYGVPVVTRHDGKHGPEFQNLKTGHNAVLYNKSEELPDILQSLARDREYGTELGHNAYQRYANERKMEYMVEGFVKCIENK